MWDIPNYRIRALMRKQRRALVGAKRLDLHLKRTKAEIHIPDKVPSKRGKLVPARVVLNDFTPRGLFLFSSEQLILGTQIELTIYEPHQFYVKGRIVACQTLILDKKIISAQDFPYRIGVE